MITPHKQFTYFLATIFIFFICQWFYRECERKKKSYTTFTVMTYLLWFQSCAEDARRRRKSFFWPTKKILPAIYFFFFKFGHALDIQQHLNVCLFSWSKFLFDAIEIWIRKFCADWKRNFGQSFETWRMLQILKFSLKFLVSKKLWPNFLRNLLSMCIIKNFFECNFPITYKTI